MGALRISEVAYELTPQEVRFVLTSVPAGFPSPAADELSDPIDLSEWLVEHPAASYIMRVEGHSMVGAGIQDQDLIVVSRAVTPRSGSMVIALVHGERTLKRLKQRAGRHWLVPEAEGYPTIIVDEHVEIWGVVVGVARRCRP